MVIADALATALRKANARVYELSHADEDRKGMGTTCVAAVVDGETLYVAHAGDSRAYLLREGLLKQLTADHSYVAEQVRAGAISEEGARKSRFRNIITRAVGIEPAIEAGCRRVRSAARRHRAALHRWPEQHGGGERHCADSDPGRFAAGCGRPAGADGEQKRRQGQYHRRCRPPESRNTHAADAGRGSDPSRTLTPRPIPRPNTWADDGAAPLSDSPSADRAPLHRLAGILAGLLDRPQCLGTAFWFGALLVHDGYHFQGAPPFAVKPHALAPPPSPPDPAHVTYGSPSVFYFMPVRGDLLTVSPKDGLITVAALSGAVVTLTPGDGTGSLQIHVCPPSMPKPPRPAGALGREWRDPAYGDRPAGQSVRFGCRRQNRHQIPAQRRCRWAWSRTCL